VGESTLSGIESANSSAKMIAQGQLVHNRSRNDFPRAALPVVLLLVSCVQWGEGFIAVAPNQLVTPLSRWELGSVRGML